MFDVSCDTTTIDLLHIISHLSLFTVIISALGRFSIDLSLHEYLEFVNMCLEINLEKVARGSKVSTFTG